MEDQEEGSEESQRRLATVVRDSNDAITVQDLDGTITAWNRGAEEMYGWTEDEALGMNIRDIVPEELREEALGFLEQIKKGEEVESLETKRVTKDGRELDVWLTVTKLVDDEGNVTDIATTERDITERKEKAAEMAETIKELSTPVVKVWEGVIMAPLVGVIDTDRADQITENLLESIQETEAEVAILDVSGVPTIDTEVSNRLMRAVKAASLLGTESILAGIRPETAETMINLGVDFSEIETCSNLRDGLELAFDKMGFEVSEDD